MTGPVARPAPPTDSSLLPGRPDAGPTMFCERGLTVGATTIAFQAEKAPCGQVVDGQHFQDQDDDCLVSDEWFYACGCRVLQHEYHDGSVSRRVVRHDGKVLDDELEAEHEHHH